MLHESTLFLMIGVLLVIDALILFIWLIVDPMKREEVRLPKVNKNDTTDFVPIIEVCVSKNQNTWLVVVYVYKGLLLLFGVFLAWETRKVKIPALNDSNYIAICVYNVVIMSILAVVINNIITKEHLLTVSYVLVALFIFVMTTATLCLLFVPKLHAIRLSTSSDPVTRSVGLEIKGRTRRFVMDESTELKESISRAEIQMRLFRRESDKMDQKIAQLEKIIKMLDRGENTKVTLRRSSSSTHSRNYVLELEQLLELPETSIGNTSTGTSEKDSTAVEISNTGAKQTLQGQWSLSTNTGAENDNTTKSAWGMDDSKSSDMYISSEADVTFSESESLKCDTASQTMQFANIQSDEILDDSDTDVDVIDNRESRNDSVSSLLEQGTIVGSDFEISDHFDSTGDTDSEKLLERTPSEDHDDERTCTSAEASETASLLEKPQKELIGKIEVTDADEEEVKKLIDEMQDVQRKLLQLNGNTKMIYYV